MRRLLFLIPLILSAQPYPQDLFAEMRWRMIGPFRGGRTPPRSAFPLSRMSSTSASKRRRVEDHRLRPYLEADLRRSATGSIGAIAVAPSDPNMIYVGSGEGLQRPDLSVGDGIYKSTDAGKTWKHLGLRDGQQISSIAVDPRDPNRVFVAVLGHPYGPNEERGMFRSTDGGESWQKVLYKDENTGARQRRDRSVESAQDLCHHCGRRGKAHGRASANGPGSGIYKSTDGGNNWRQLMLGPARRSPTVWAHRASASAPSNPRRMYAARRGPARAADSIAPTMPAKAGPT